MRGSGRGRRPLMRRGSGSWSGRTPSCAGPTRYCARRVLFSRPSSTATSHGDRVHRRAPSTSATADPGAPSPWSRRPPPGGCPGSIPAGSTARSVTSRPPNTSRPGPRAGCHEPSPPPPACAGPRRRQGHALRPDQVGVPAQHGPRGDDQAKLAAVPLGEQSGQRRQDRAVRPGQPGCVDVALEHHDLVAKDPRSRRL